MTLQEIKDTREAAKNFFGKFTDEQVSAQYLGCAKINQQMYEKAIKLGKPKYRGYTIEQLKKLMDDFYQLANYKY